MLQTEEANTNQQQQQQSNTCTYSLFSQTTLVPEKCGNCGFFFLHHTCMITYIDTAYGDFNKENLQMENNCLSCVRKTALEFGYTTIE